MTARPASQRMPYDLTLPGPKCPRCAGGAVARSRRRSVLERMTKLMNLGPYRCLDCYHRFFGCRRLVRGQ
jgi:hypothetical protein